MITTEWHVMYWRSDGLIGLQTRAILIPFMCVGCPLAWVWSPLWRSLQEYQIAGGAPCDDRIASFAQGCLGTTGREGGEWVSEEGVMEGGREDSKDINKWMCVCARTTLWLVPLTSSHWWQALASNCLLSSCRLTGTLHLKPVGRPRRRMTASLLGEELRRDSDNTLGFYRVWCGLL